MAAIPKAKFSIPFKWVAITAYAILIIPILIFFIGWLKWYFGIIFSAILLFGAFWLIKKDYWKNEDKIELPVFHFALIVIVFGIWIIFAGNCGIGVSNYDTKWRTAILRDLIEYDWPVYYPETGSNLCYYFVFWMIPALFGKLMGLTGAFVIQWLWTLLIVVVSFLIISYIFKDYGTNMLWLICSFIVLWSGINLLGSIITDVLDLNLYGIGLNMNEAYCDAFFNGESFNFLYRSDQDLISNPYNQILIWIAVPLFLQNRKIHNYAFIGLVLLPFSPWGTIGTAFFMVIDAVRCIYKESFKVFIKEAFSVQNICAIMSVFIVFALFFTANSRTSGQEGGGFGILTLSKFDAPRILGLIVFWLCEFGIYSAFIWKKFRNDYTFVSLLPILLLIPFFWIGSIWGRDFCMNASVPALFIFMIYMIKYVKEEVANKKLDLKNFALVSCLLIASTTPIFYWCGKTKTLIVEQTLVVQDDSFYTLSNKTIESNANFLVDNADETPFFKYLAKSYGAPLASAELSGISAITDIDEYLDYLKGKDCTIFIAIRDISSFSLRQETVDRMKLLGFGNELDTLIQKEHHSFIGIVKNGSVVAQQIGGDEYISYKDTVDDYPVIMETEPFSSLNLITIDIKGNNYSVDATGFNIVVSDNSTGFVIDSAAFDTQVDENTCYRLKQHGEGK